jgi:hypothetical protein
VEIIMIDDKIHDAVARRFIVCGNYYDWWWDWLYVEIIMIDDKIDDKIYCMWKLLWLMITLIMRFIVCENYYDWW